MRNRKGHIKEFVLYVLRFAAVFCICYYGTLAVIGLSAPGGYYSEFIEKHFDYVSLLRKSLLQGSGMLLSLNGYKTVLSNLYTIRMQSGTGVHIGFDCLGYGLMSFWIAFVVTNTGTFIGKVTWVIGGLFLIWLINIARISLLLVAVNKRWSIPVFDHHTWFNIAAYTLVFVLIYFYDRSKKINQSSLKSI